MINHQRLGRFGVLLVGYFVSDFTLSCCQPCEGFANYSSKRSGFKHGMSRIGGWRSDLTDNGCENALKLVKRSTADIKFDVGDKTIILESYFSQLAEKVRLTRAPGPADKSNDTAIGNSTKVELLHTLHEFLIAHGI